MRWKKRIGLHELFAQDPAEAERLLWGRTDRRGFLKDSAVMALTTALGARMVYASDFPFGMIPAGLAHREDNFQLPGKHPELVVLNDRPINAETPPHLLDDPVTPADRFFVRNNGLPPAVDAEALAKWTLTIEGEAAAQRKVYTLAELKTRFPVYSMQLTLECGGNGRKEFNPPAKGNQWSTGAVGCSSWTGVRLRDVLNDVGLKSNAVYMGYYGRDTHLSGDANKVVISRGVPIPKALEEESLITWAMNGEDLPLLNGYPLRLVFGGWPASCSGKWLDRIVIRDRVHDGPKMDGQSYRIPCRPVAPGTKVADEDMCIIEAMPVKSVITFPKTGAMLKLGQHLPVRGKAWCGSSAVGQVDLSIDFGQTWQACDLEAPINRHAWQPFTGELSFPQRGYYEVWARATDAVGRSQPMLLPGWNPKGYLNNACHRIAIKIV